MTERRPLPYDWAEIRARLQRKIWDVLGELRLKNELGRNPDGDKRRIFPRNPMRNDRKAGSFCIWVDAGREGAWKDFACQSQGDIFDLIAGVVGLTSKIDTYWWAVDFLNLDRKGFTDRPRQANGAEIERRRREADRLAAEAKAAEDDERRSADLFRLWLGLKPIAGTPAETYLREARCIPLDRLPELPGALRWAEAVDGLPDPETGEIHTWRNVMVAAMTRGKKVVALHRTYLKPDGSGKADRTKAKLMIGPTRGSAIRLTKGPSNLSPNKAAEAGKLGALAIGEGIETSLTVACARPDYRVWAAGSLDAMRGFTWPACASAVVLLMENDQGEAARAAAQRVEDHWNKEARGRPVAVVRSLIGSDFNDWARGKA